MSGHLPECWASDQIDRLDPLCICDRLRACEQRVVSGPMSMPSYLNGRQRGYAAGLDAARDAVAAVPPIDQWVDDNGLVSLVYDKGEALAAIDALRGKS